MILVNGRTPPRTITYTAPIPISLAPRFCKEQTRAAGSGFEPLPQFRCNRSVPRTDGWIPS